MNFDSHLYAVMAVAVRLVNALTPGQAGGHPYAVPSGAARNAAVAEALSGEGRRRPRVSVVEADSLQESARLLRLVFERVEAGHLAQAAEVVNELLVSTGARPQLDFDRVEGWNVHFHGRDDTLATGWAAGCATGLALAIGSRLTGRLGVCAATACDRVYVDGSRNGAKRFCSTACQSRTKAAAFRRRSG